MRRTIILAVLAIALTFPAAASADTAPGPSGPGNQVHYLNRGSGGFAYFDNVAWTDEGIPPGTYFWTFVDFSSNVSTNAGQSWASSYACVYHESFVIDEFGGWTPLEFLSGCVDGATLAKGRNLSTAGVTASIPVFGCAIDPQTWDCLDTFEGTVDVDVTLTGTGPTYRFHHAFAGGTAGLYQSAFHGVGSERAAIPSGSVALDGVSLTDGAANSGGWIWNVKSGWVDVFIGY